MGLGMHSGEELTMPPPPPPPPPPGGRGVSPTLPGMVAAVVVLAFLFLLGLVQVKDVRLKVLSPEYINI